MCDVHGYRRAVAARVRGRARRLAAGGAARRRRQPPAHGRSQAAAGARPASAWRWAAMTRAWQCGRVGRAAGRSAAAWGCEGAAGPPRRACSGLPWSCRVVSGNDWSVWSQRMARWAQWRAACAAVRAARAAGPTRSPTPSARWSCAASGPACTAPLSGSTPPRRHVVVARPELAERGPRLLVAGGGCRLGAWRVWAPRPARLEAVAAGDLATRLRQLRARRALPEQEEPEPSEAEVREACAAPAASCRLPAPLVGLALDE
ncbi:hypothetical protein HF086_007181, partial [Spodoptera exigua]